MSYDFFVFPADRAGSLEQATGLYESAPETGTLTPGGPMASFLADLNALSPMTSGTEGFLSAPAEGHDAAAYVATSWQDPMANLKAISAIARRHELSVLDVQLTALYDPRGALDVGLDTEAGPQLAWLTRTVLHEVLGQILDGRYHYVILERASMEFAQAYVEDDGTWTVEHRDGSPDLHFAARTRDASLVEPFLWAWATDHEGWRKALPFNKIDV